MIAFYAACGVLALVALFVWALGRSASQQGRAGCGHKPDSPPPAIKPSPDTWDLHELGFKVRRCRCAQCAPVSQCAGSATTASTPGLFAGSGPPASSTGAAPIALTQGSGTTPAGAANFEYADKCGGPEKFEAADETDAAARESASGPRDPEGLPPGIRSVRFVGGPADGKVVELPDSCTRYVWPINSFAWEAAEYERSGDEMFSYVRTYSPSKELESEMGRLAEEHERRSAFAHAAGRAMAMRHGCQLPRDPVAPLAVIVVDSGIKLDYEVIT